MENCTICGFKIERIWDKESFIEKVVSENPLQMFIFLGE